MNVTIQPFGKATAGDRLACGVVTMGNLETAAAADSGTTAPASGPQ